MSISPDIIAILKAPLKLSPKCANCDELCGQKFVTTSNSLAFLCTNCYTALSHTFKKRPRTDAESSPDAEPVVDIAPKNVRSGQTTSGAAFQFGAGSTIKPTKNNDVLF